MTTRRTSPDLGPNAEAALAAFPIPERDWERAARAVEARLSSGVRGTTDHWLLAAPLPSEPGEGDLSSATTTPLLNSGVRTQPLTEIARRSAEQRHAEDREMVRETLAIAARQRPFGHEERALRQQLLGAPKVIPTAATVPTAAEVPLPTSTRAAPPLGRSRWTPLALAMPALALAAAALVWLGQREPPPPLIENPELVVVRPGAKPAPDARSDERAPSVRVIDPSTLPAEAQATAVEAEAKGGAGRSTSAGKPNHEKLVLQDESAEPAALVDSSLPPDPALRPADSSSGERSLRPTTGAVQAALGAVMAGARRCIASNERPSSAVVMFGSDGHVQNVSITGPAAKAASAACIQVALGRARVEPFAAPTFSVTTTVRPE